MMLWITFVNKIRILFLVHFLFSFKTYLQHKFSIEKPTIKNSWWEFLSGVLLKMIYELFD